MGSADGGLFAVSFDRSGGADDRSCPVTDNLPAELVTLLRWSKRPLFAPPGSHITIAVERRYGRESPVDGWCSEDSVLA